MNAQINVSSDTQSMNEEPSLARWIEAHDLLIFFVLTFLLTFGTWLIAMITGAGWLFDLGLWGPALSAILATVAIRGKPGLKDLFRRVMLWRVPARWYMLIFFGWPLVSILAAFLYARITNQPLQIHWNRWSGFLTYLLSAPVLGFWACEEIGWRGFALPRLLNRWSALFSSIILGIIWAGWHLPYYLGNNGINPGFYTLPVFTVSLSILMTWIWNHTKGSLFVATFFHFWINIYDGFQSDKLPLNDPAGETIVKYLLLAGAAVLVVFLYGDRSLIRDRKSVPSQINW